MNRWWRVQPNRALPARETFHAMKSILSGLLLACCLGQQSFAASAVDVLTQPARQGSQALQAVLQDVTRAGDRLVAVGERGVVLYSDDNGQQWVQASVPVSSTLTAAQFVDAHEGWAVGHAAVVLHTTDSGQSWALQLDGKRAAALEFAAAEHSGEPSRIAAAQRLMTEGADKPLLALHFSDAMHGLVVGAYGLAMTTADGGRTWQSAMATLPNPRSLHLYALAQQGQTLFVVGEQGLLLRSRDAGHSFQALSSPYEGSLFAAAVLPDGRLLIGGLRGHLFASHDQGASFQPQANPLPASLNAIRVVGQRLLMVNEAGALLHSELDKISVQPMPGFTGRPLTAVTEAADGALICAGVAGPVRMPMPKPQSIAD